ncbi:hypothetical protein MTR_2g067340 [Medicago truncatula]|uniref:Uncharacterized protein n=1 Tax=Medicago truncatula TaxID=3880 RepID=A0A072VA80_MEDTR|nr:hypothetical protein MTR_2g067340 [Medicago truncatula]
MEKWTFYWAIVQTLSNQITTDFANVVSFTLSRNNDEATTSWFLMSLRLQFAAHPHFYILSWN